MNIIWWDFGIVMATYQQRARWLSSGILLYIVECCHHFVLRLALMVMLTYWQFCVPISSTEIFKYRLNFWDMILYIYDTCRMYQFQKSKHKNYNESIRNQLWIAFLWAFIYIGVNIILHSFSTPSAQDKTWIWCFLLDGTGNCSCNVTLNTINSSS